LLSTDTNATLCICINDWMKKKGLWGPNEVKTLKEVSKDSSVHRTKMLELWNEYREANSGVCNVIRLKAGPKHGIDPKRIEPRVDKSKLGPAISHFVPPPQHLPPPARASAGKQQDMRKSHHTMSQKSMHIGKS
jgi:hypothetical protein